MQTQNSTNIESPSKKILGILFTQRNTKMRTTNSTLDKLVAKLNKMTDAPLEAFVMVRGRSVAQPGNYHITTAFKGVSLHKITNDYGGIQDVFGRGPMTKRELYSMMVAFIVGYETAQANSDDGRGYN